MILAAEFGTGQVLWSVLWLSLFVLWFWLVITLFADIMMSENLSGWGKALWALGIIIMPFLGIILYLIVNGGRMSRQMADEARANPDIEQAMAAGSTADELARLAALRDAGTITDAEFDHAKARALAD